MMSWRESYPYPQNLLRNVAKSGCPTNYTYIPDIGQLRLHLHSRYRSVRTTPIIQI